MRKLWIMRHGDALWKASSDRLRALSENGVSQAKSIANQISFPESTVLLASPYLRAQQTAKVLVEHHSGLSIKRKIGSLRMPILDL